MKSAATAIAVAIATATAGLVLPVESATVSTPTAKAAILRQEARWLDALMKGDRASIASLLAPGYKHINSSGTLLDRDQELATASEQAGPMKWTDETITLSGNTGIVHGLNTMDAAGKTVRERFTDVFVNQNGTWLAIAAQETTVAK
jgi:hypothetical protein